MGGGPPRAGRFSFSITHLVRLEDTVVLRAGQPALDLLAGQSLGGGSGQRENQIEFEGGLTWRGIGLRTFGNWIGEGQQVGAGPSGDLAFEDRLTLNLRAFVNFDDRTTWVGRWPVLRGTRLVVAVENATDDAAIARDRLGQIPSAYQAGFRAPEGRRVEVRLRRQF